MTIQQLDIIDQMIHCGFWHPIRWRRLRREWWRIQRGSSA